MASPSPEFLTRSRPMAAPQTISLSVTTAKHSSALTPGKYQAWATVAWFARQGTFSSVTAALTDTPIQAYQILTFYVIDGDGTDTGLAGILAASTGTAYVQELK